MPLGKSGNTSARSSKLLNFFPVSFVILLLFPDSAFFTQLQYMSIVAVVVLWSSHSRHWSWCEVFGLDVDPTGSHQPYLLWQAYIMAYNLIKWFLNYAL